MIEGFGLFHYKISSSDGFQNYSGIYCANKQHYGQSGHAPLCCGEFYSSGEFAEDWYLMTEKFNTFKVNDLI